jgi:Flp pilus assembly protein TadB
VDAKKSLGRRLTSDRLVEELRASAGNSSGFNFGGSLVRRNSKSRISLKRHYRKFAWIFGSTAIVIALLYWEQAAVLYLLSTLAMCALLLVVAFSNLEARDKELHQTALENMDDRDAESTRSVSANKRVA